MPQEDWGKVAEEHRAQIDDDEEEFPLTTALHCASHGGHRDVVSLLIAQCAVVDRKNRAGDTPLASASFQGHVDVVSLLIDKDAQTLTTLHPPSNGF